MLKVRLIPVMTFNGVSLVKTKQFTNARTVGNPIQVARVYNSRNVDELVFVDIKATEQGRKINLPLVKKVIDECFMPVTIGGGIRTFEDINDLLGIGADKVLIKSKALQNPEFIVKAVEYFGSQCISIAVDVIVKDREYLIHQKNDEKVLMKTFIEKMHQCNVGEFVVNSVVCDGMMNGFDKILYQNVSQITTKPIVAVGGAGVPSHFTELVQTNYNGALAASSIYHFTQYTPQEVKKTLNKAQIPVRI
ncbi:HisA/HisF-related TIM barrel protein [Flavobacteriaceae bacterium]|mgnify:CR=1 FL=1|nr:HisA/HisF-related TIM barrel protein [Flavobacteriaceae bacterium]